MYEVRIRLDIPGSVSFTCNFTIANAGTFNSTLDVSVNDGGDIQLDGDVSLANWAVSNSQFAINSFDFELSMDTSTGYFNEATSGDLQMGAQTGVTFDGLIEVTNGALQDLQFDFDYFHGGQSYAFTIALSSGAIPGRGDLVGAREPFRLGRSLPSQNHIAGECSDLFNTIDNRNNL
ncbi:MAG: hypothetical protein HQ526_06320 [Actinobacteria bacterium]|nr:hypothetical protein [Actinomycetota bacterium]